MRVVISNATLRQHRSCGGVYTSPYWDAAENALVYPDWDAAVKNYFMVISDGLERLEWQVRHKLVPTTPEEFVALKKAKSNE
jgi:hypothetical protein